MLSTEEIRTSRLDDITEVGAIDFLKIDIQGGELMALVGSRAKLATAGAIRIEVSFVALYRGQPTFADIDRELRGQGFVLHTFASVKRWRSPRRSTEGTTESPITSFLRQMRSTYGTSRARNP